MPYTPFWWNQRASSTIHVDPSHPRSWEHIPVQCPNNNCTCHALLIGNISNRRNCSFSRWYTDLCCWYISCGFISIHAEVIRLQRCFNLRSSNHIIWPVVFRDRYLTEIHGNFTRVTWRSDLLVLKNTALRTSLMNFAAYNCAHNLCECRQGYCYEQEV